MKTFCVEELDKPGTGTCVVSGCGRHRGTLDFAAKTLRTAQRWAAELRKRNPGKTYRVTETN